ncbi:XRE family transcriptional regulator [Streptomyces sp. NPDC020801]|uniref:XRE family transcriptional regulator n=1 Tax=unclassified Streptomyces TaxID=2593676 RepID=UPI0037BBF249
MDLEVALFRLPQVSPVRLLRLLRLVGQGAAARWDCWATQCIRLGQVLPALIAAAQATRDASKGRTRDEAHLALASSYHAPLGAIHRRGEPADEGSRRPGLDTRPNHGRPYHAAADRRVLGGHRQGQDDGPVPDRGGRAGNGPQVRRARPVHHRSHPSPVDAYKISLLNALGTPDEGVDVAARLDIDHMPTPELRARAWTDIARMWNALGDAPQTRAALQRVEQKAPQEVCRPALRILTAGLLYGPTRVEGVSEFAARTGALTA